MHHLPNTYATCWVLITHVALVSVGSYECKKEKRQKGKKNPKEIRTWVTAAQILLFYPSSPFYLCKHSLIIPWSYLGMCLCYNKQGPLFSLGGQLFPCSEGRGPASLAVAYIWLVSCHSPFLCPWKILIDRVMLCCWAGTQPQNPSWHSSPGSRYQLIGIGMRDKMMCHPWFNSLYPMLIWLGKECRSPTPFPTPLPWPRCLLPIYHRALALWGVMQR